MTHYHDYLMASITLGHRLPQGTDYLRAPITPGHTAADLTAICCLFEQKKKKMAWKIITCRI